MPNRVQREGAKTSRKLAKASDAAETMFWRLNTTVDDFGRYFADPAIVRAACFPKSLETHSEEDVRRRLDELETGLHLIIRYVVDGEHYLILLNTDPPRAKKSKFPEPPPEVSARAREWAKCGPPSDLGESARTCSHVQADARTCEQTPTSASTCAQMLPYSYSESDSKSESKEKPPAPDGASVLEFDFEEFLEAYPRPPGDPRKPAFEKYRAARRKGATRQELLEGIRADIADRRARDSRGEFVPAMPETKAWLHQERWKDALANARRAPPGAVAAGPGPPLAERQVWLARMAEMRRANRKAFEHVLNSNPESIAALDAELDALERETSNLIPTGQQAAGGSA